MKAAVRNMSVGAARASGGTRRKAGRLKLAVNRSTHLRAGRRVARKKTPLRTTGRARPGISRLRPKRVRLKTATPAKRGVRRRASSSNVKRMVARTPKRAGRSKTVLKTTRNGQARKSVSQSPKKTVRRASVVPFKGKRQRQAGPDKPHRRTRPVGAKTHARAAKHPAMRSGKKHQRHAGLVEIPRPMKLWLDHTPPTRSAVVPERKREDMTWREPKKLAPVAPPTPDSTSRGMTGALPTLSIPELSTTDVVEDVNTWERVVRFGPRDYQMPDIDFLRVLSATTPQMGNVPVPPDSPVDDGMRWDEWPGADDPFADMPPDDVSPDDVPSAQDATTPDINTGTVPGDSPGDAVEEWFDARDAELKALSTAPSVETPSDTPSDSHVDSQPGGQEPDFDEFIR